MLLNGAVYEVALAEISPRSGEEHSAAICAAVFEATVYKGIAALLL